MNGATHLTVGLILAVAVAQVDHQPLVIAAAVVGALLPDIDHPRAMISQFLPGMGLIRWAAGISHRGITHTVWFAVIATLVMATIQPAAAVSLAYGIASHLILDMATPAGVRLFHPVLRMRFGVGWLLGIASVAVALGWLMWAG